MNKEGYTKEKENHNKIYAKKTVVCSEYFPDSEIKTIIIEGESGRTTKHLLEHGIKEEEICIINDDSDIIKELSYMYRFQFVHDKAENAFDIDYGIDTGGKPVASIFLDFCCSFDGNIQKGYCPKKVILDALNYTNEHSFIMATFCLRNRKGFTFEKEQKYIINSLKELLPSDFKITARRYGSKNQMLNVLLEQSNKKRRLYRIDEYTFF